MFGYYILLKTENTVTKYFFKYMNSAWNPILIKILLKKVLVGPVNSAHEPFIQTQTQLNTTFINIQTEAKYTMTSDSEF